MNATELCLFLVVGYVATVCIEIPVLMWGLHPRHSRSFKMKAGFVLTAFTYPIVVLVLPATIMPYVGRVACIAIAETYAPLAEMLFFRYLVDQKLLTRPDRNAVTILLANVLSFVIGLVFLSEWLMAIVRWLARSLFG